MKILIRDELERDYRRVEEIYDDSLNRARVKIFDERWRRQGPILAALEAADTLIISQGDDNYEGTALTTP